MYSITSVKGAPAILFNRRTVLSGCNQDWNFAYDLCAVLNGLANQRPSLVLTESDRKWLTAIDHSFQVKVQDA